MKSDRLESWTAMVKEIVDAGFKAEVVEAAEVDSTPKKLTLESKPGIVLFYYTEMDDFDLSEVSVFAEQLALNYNIGGDVWPENETCQLDWFKEFREEDFIIGEIHRVRGALRELLSDGKVEVVEEKGVRKYKVKK